MTRPRGMTPTWSQESVKRIDGFKRDWWIRSSENRTPLREKIELVTHDDPLLYDCKVKMEITSSRIKWPPHSKGDYRVYQANKLVEIMSLNDEEFLEPDLWQISQLEDLDRVGPTCFSGMPFNYFLSFWRQPLKPKFISMERVGRGTAMINFRYMDKNHPLYYTSVTCNLYLKWRGLFDDLRREKKDQTIVTWLRKNCEGRIYLFSDFDSIFESPVDEFRYIADIEL